MGRSQVADAGVFIGTTMLIFQTTVYMFHCVGRDRCQFSYISSAVQGIQFVYTLFVPRLMRTFDIA